MKHDCEPFYHKVRVYNFGEIYEPLYLTEEMHYTETGPSERN